MFNNLFKKNQKMKSEYIDFQVKLKRIAGIHPGVYLSAIYITILFLLLFMLFFLPGIINNGTRVYFNSSPAASSVWVNGEYAGTTPFKGFLSKGENEVIFKKPGFKQSGEVLKTKGYVFATLFKSPELTINKELEINNYAEIYNNALYDLLRWASVKDFHESYQPEYLIAKTVSMFKDNGRENRYTELFLEKCFKNITNENLFKDFIKADIICRNGNSALLPYDIIDSALYYAESFTENPAQMIQLLSIIKDSNLINIDDRDNFIFAIENKKMQKFRQKDSGKKKPAVYTETVAGKRYAVIPEGNYFTGEYPQTKISINNQDIAPTYSNYLAFAKFYMAENKITNREYLDFVNENPSWNRGNIKILIENNLVNKTYLSHWAGDNTPISSDMDKPVYNISWYAAEAYCNWLTKKINMNNFKAVIPDEYMWEVSENNAASLNMMNNVLWEWCSNWFNYADYINPERCYANIPANPSGNTSVSEYSNLDGIEKSVRGGSWANKNGEIKPFTRASQPPDWCTPFIGFRVALVSENRK